MFWDICKLIFPSLVAIAVLMFLWAVFDENGSKGKSLPDVTFGIDKDLEVSYITSQDRKTLNILTVKSCERDEESGLYRVVSFLVKEGDKDYDVVALSNRKFEIGDKVHHVSFVVLPRPGAPKHMNSVFFAIPATNEVAVTNR